MEIAAGLIKLKTNSSEKVEIWKDTLESRRNEAIQTLIDEGVRIESWFEVEIEGQSYLLWYMRKEPDAKFHEVYEKSTHDIDKFHAEIMASIVDVSIVAKPILDLEQSG